MPNTKGRQLRKMEKEYRVETGSAGLNRPGFIGDLVS